MKGQISRDSHRPDRRFSGVYHVQGAMVTDADLDECTDLAKDRTDALGNDAIRDGVPAIGGAVVISGSGVALGEGVVYADGVRGVLAAAGATSGGPLGIFGQQADLPLGPALPAAPRIIYADVWERPVFALEDPYLADPGLHGAETTYRSRTMTQIKAAPLAAAAAIEQGSGDFPQIGDAVLAVTPRDSQSTIDECDPCAEVVAAEQTIANALFRLEVVRVEGKPSAPSQVHLAWSAENGAAIAPAGVSPEEFERAGAAYEFFSEITESYMGAFADPADLRHSTFVDDLEATPNPPQDHDGSDWPFVRRWDGHGIVDLTTGTVAATLGSGFTLGFDGTTVTLGLDTFDAKLTLAGHRVLRGDYWLVELRTFADPASRVRLVQATPVGILHHYCLLVRTRRGVIEPLTDAERRKLSLPPLSDLPASHVGFVNTCPKLYGDAENVQDALDELCAISAEDVGFDPSNCPSLYDEAKTVQEALDRLCGRQTGGGCHIVVDPAGQPTLNDLMVAHGQNSAPLCVCLLPGEHLLEAAVDNPKLVVDIAGCGAEITKIRVQGNWKVGAASLKVADTSVLLTQPDTGLQVAVRNRFELEGSFLASVTKETPLLSVSAGERIRIADTTLEAMASSAMGDLFRFFEEGTHGDIRDQQLFELLEHDRFDAAVDDLADQIVGMSDADRGTYRSELVSFLDGAERLTLLERFGIEQLILHCDQDAPASTYRADFLRLRHAAAFSRPAPALVIETAVAQTLIESSEIRGVLSFYGPPADNPLARDQARALSQVGRELTVFSTHRSLHVRGNRLARIAADQKTVDQVRLLTQGARFSDIFRQAFLSNNVIECDANAFIAAAHHLADLRFQNQEGQREFLGYVVGTHAAYTGLSCEITSINGVPELYDLTTRGSDRAVLVDMRVVP
jgi:Family of unknown function (DUF6519)